MLAHQRKAYRQFTLLMAWRRNRAAIEHVGNRWVSDRLRDDALEAFFARDLRDGRCDKLHRGRSWVAERGRPRPTP